MADGDNEKQNALQPYTKDVHPEDIVEDEPLTWRFWRKRRYIVVMLAFFGFFNVYALRVNLSVAIVAMTQNRTMMSENGTVYYEQDFPWTSQEKGLILSSFFYGYITTQILGGYLGSRLGGNLVYGIGIGTTAFLTLLTPLAAKHGIATFMTLRIVEGVFEGVTFPCIHAVWARWAPPLERSRMASTAFAGAYAGTVTSMTLSGIFAEHLGWESVFYIFGTIGCIWYAAWVIVVREGPEKDPYCSPEETYFIEKKLGTVGRTHVSHPWKAIWTSTAVHAIIVSNFAENWGFYTLLTQLPQFLRDTLDYNLDKTGFFSAVPYLVMGLTLGVAGYLADWSQVKGYLTTTQVRRYFNCGAFVAQTIFMVCTAYLPDPRFSVLYITIAVGFGAFAWCGFAVNHLDIAPQHASVIFGICNMFATIPGIASPIVNGYLVQHQTVDEWRNVFFISASFYLFGCIFYWFFASGELQDWAKTPEQLAAEKLAKESIEETQAQQGKTNVAVEVKE